MLGICNSSGTNIDKEQLGLVQNL